MSLDVHLTVKGKKTSTNGSGIFIREDGRTREISREEWDSKFPNAEPVVASFDDDDSGCVYEQNITHNLGTMADKAGVYMCLWRPEEIEISHAAQLIEPLEKGLSELKSKPEYYKQFNPPNGWGTYDGLVQFVSEYLEACKAYPQAEVSVSR